MLSMDQSLLQTWCWACPGASGCVSQSRLASSLLWGLPACPSRLGCPCVSPVAKTEARELCKAPPSLQPLPQLIIQQRPFQPQTDFGSHLTRPPPDISAGVPLTSAQDPPLSSSRAGADCEVQRCFPQLHGVGRGAVPSQALEGLSQEPATGAAADSEVAARSRSDPLSQPLSSCCSSNCLISLLRHREEKQCPGA